MLCANNDEQSVRKGSLFHVRTIMSKLWEKGHYAMSDQWWTTCKERVIMPCANNDQQPVRKKSLCHVQIMMKNLWEKGHYAMCEQWWVTCDKIHYTMSEQWWATCEKSTTMRCANNDEQPVTRAIIPCANIDEQPVRKEPFCHVRTVNSNM